MCGIAGIIKRRGEVLVPDLRRMADALAHRGPDDAGFYTDGPVGLAHRRLSIIDLAGGHQPLQSVDGSLSLVANGEIYNFIELREELEKRGCNFATHSDSETILHAYAVYGAAFVDHLNGMFAFALYDRQRKKLLLGRDRLGIKPLFYAVLPDRILFASELKAILPVLPGAPAIHPEALVEFLQNQFNTGEETIFAGIRRLPPGCILSCDADLNIEVHRYWTAGKVRTRKISFEQASEEFDDLMETVMREHLRSDVPYGLFLSGGVDSAVLLSLMDRFQSQPVRTFSVGFKAEMEGELDEAQYIASRFRTHHTPLHLSRDMIFKRLPLAVWGADDLMRDYACLPTSILAEEAGKELKVVFSGEGGDEVFAGYGRYRPTFLERTVKGILSPGSGGFRTRGQLRKTWMRQIFSPRLQAVSPSFRQPFRKAWNEAPAQWSDMQKRQYTDLITALPDNLLVKADRMLMSFGVEGRVPFLDHRIVEFGLSLPDNLKIRSRQGKYFLKRWAEGSIPRDYLQRRKRGFHVPIGEWLKGSFVDRLEDKLLNNAGIQTWFRKDGVRNLFAAKRKGQGVNREIWSLLQFAIWHRLFLEKSGIRPQADEEVLDWV